MPRRDYWAVAALIAFFALVFVAVFGERIAPYEQTYFVIEHGRDPRPYDPGVVFPFGSDVLGRDLFSVVLAGARATLTIVFLAGLARVAAGVLIAGVSSWWRPAKIGVETVADVVAAIPATLVAVIFIKALVRQDTTVPIVVGTLLLVGWASPYRVLRAELDRLASAPFSEGAQVVGVSRLRLLWRHHVPHLAPVMAINLTQQIVASLVLLAELGVLGIVLSTVRYLDVSDSLRLARFGDILSAYIPAIPEWGALLSSARSAEILWLTRWVIFIPGAAFAITAGCVALIGFTLARRYARRDVIADLRGAAAIAGAVAAMIVVGQLIPERYVEAQSWAMDARRALLQSSEPARDLTAAGLDVTSVTRSTTVIERVAPATVIVNGVALDESYREAVDHPKQIHIRSVVSGDVGGGGTVEAPLVFVGRGIIPSELFNADAPPVMYTQTRPTGPPLGRLLQNYPNDFAAVDVRGKIVLIVTFTGIDAGPYGRTDGFVPSVGIQGALDRGAAGVIFVDPQTGLGSGPALEASASPTTQFKPTTEPNPWVRLEKALPRRTVTGVPVIAMDMAAAKRLIEPLGLDLTSYLADDSSVPARSPARDLGVSARISVPLRSETTRYTSLVAEVPHVPADRGRIVVWTRRGLGGTAVEILDHDVLSSFGRFAAARAAPFVFVDYDPRADTQAVRELLQERGMRVLLVIVLDRLDGGQLAFYSASGDLIPSFNLYAERATTSYDITRKSFAAVQDVYKPLPEYKSVILTSYSGDGDRRGDALAWMGYLAGRLALGAPELGR